MSATPGASISNQLAPLIHGASIGMLCFFGYIQWIIFFLGFITTTCFFGHTIIAHMLCAILYTLTIARSWVFYSHNLSLRAFLLYSIPFELFFLVGIPWRSTVSLVLFEHGSFIIWLLEKFTESQLTLPKYRDHKFLFTSLRFLSIITIQVMSSTYIRYITPDMIYGFEIEPSMRFYNYPKIVRNIPNMPIILVHSNIQQADKIFEFLPFCLAQIPILHSSDFKAVIRLLPAQDSLSMVRLTGSFSKKNHDITIYVRSDLTSRSLEADLNAERSYARTLTHELTHWAVHTCMQCNPPLWKDEGYAEYLAKRTLYPSKEALLERLFIPVWEKSEYKIDHPFVLPSSRIPHASNYDKKISSLDYKAALLQAIYFLEVESLSHEEFLVQDFPPASIDAILEWLDPSDTLELYSTVDAE